MSYWKECLSSRNQLKEWCFLPMEVVAVDYHLAIKLLPRLTCSKKLEIIPNATHLFEEPGCLEEVARLAKEWFRKHLNRKSG